MFKAIGRYLKALGYLVTGRVDAARKTLNTNPYVVQATYDNIITEKTKRINQYKDAVAGLISNEEKKLAKIKGLTNDVARLEQLKEGAAAKARRLVEQLKSQGLTLEQIKGHEDYRACLAAFNDFSTTLTEKNDRIGELEADISGISSSIANHKVQLQQLVREIDKLREESHEAVADIITAKEEQEIADMITGISEDTTAKELQEMRDLRHQMKARARVSRELAGTDTAQQEAEFLDYARKNASNTEFDELIGLAASADRGVSDVAPPSSESRLPEG